MKAASIPDVLALLEDEFGTDYVFGESDPDDIAADWEATGMSPREVGSWVRAGAFEPSAATALDRYGLRAIDCSSGSPDSIAARAAAGEIDAAEASAEAAERKRFCEPVPGSGVEELPWDLHDFDSAMVSVFAAVAMKPGQRGEVQAFGAWTRHATTGRWYLPVSLFMPASPPVVIARSYVWGEGTRTKPPTSLMPWVPQESDEMTWLALGYGDDDKNVLNSKQIEVVPAAWRSALHEGAGANEHDISLLCAVAKALESIARDPSESSRLLQL